MTKKIKYALLVGAGFKRTVAKHQDGIKMAEITITCSNCGTKNHYGLVYCTNCGEALGGGD